MVHGGRWMDKSLDVGVISCMGMAMVLWEEHG